MKLNRKILILTIMIIMMIGILHCPVMAKTPYMESLKGVSWDLKPGRAVVYQTYVKPFGLKNQKVKITKYSIGKSKREGYKRLTITLKWYRTFSLTNEEIKNYWRNIEGGGFYYAIVDYNTGLSLMNKNDKGVKTWRSKGFDYIEPKVFFHDEGWWIIRNAEATVIVEYPETNKDLCLCVGGILGTDNTKNNDTFWEGKIPIGKSDSYYSKRNKKLCHCMRITE